MGTDKRERQRANKAHKEHQVARAQTRQKTTRIAVIVIGAIVAVFAIAFGANTFFGDDDNGDSPQATEALPAVQGEGVVDEATGEVVPEGCPSPDGESTQTQNFASPPPMCLDPNVSYSALVSTNKGDITIQLDQAKAPTTVNNFVFLARHQYFDDTTCHRIIPGFVVQCGDPDGTGTGGPGYDFADELPQAGEYQIGSIAMANSGPNTNGSQFFIITGDSGAALPPSYSLFGDVASGFDDTVVQMEAAGTQSGSPTEPVEINSITIEAN